MCAIEYLAYMLTFVVISTYGFDAAHANDEYDATDNNPLMVCVQQGCLEGTTLPGYQVDTYEAFLGIPYAEPPVHQLRFAVSILCGGDTFSLCRCHFQGNGRAVWVFRRDKNGPYDRNIFVIIGVRDNWV